MDFVGFEFRGAKKKYNQNKLNDLKLCIFSYRDNKLRCCLGENLWIMHKNYFS